MLLHDAFERAARRLPDKTALVCGDRRVSYAALHQRARALAAMLQSDGVRPGDRVVVLLENDVEYAVAVHAVLIAGAVFVPLVATTKADKLAFVIDETEARLLLTDARLASVWAELPVHSPTLRRIRAAGIAGASAANAVVSDWPSNDAVADADPVRRIDQDLAALIYTSGSTGRPKGVMLTHLNMVSAWASVQSYLGLREDDVVGLVIPPAFSYGLYNLLMGLGIGATVVQVRSAAFPLRLAQTLEHERVTVFPGVPTLFAALLELPALERMDLRSIRLLTNAAAALPSRHLERLRAAWPQAAFISMYGLTECMRASYLPLDQVDTRPSSVGRGLPNQEHWLADAAGQRLPDGTSGELVLRGSHVMRGYWKRPDETAQRLKPGPIDGEWALHTGDLFRSDAEGYLYFVARMDDIIKTRGEKVAPREVEEVIHRLDGVTGCAVIGVPDEALGHAVKAYVTLRQGSPLVARDIVRHCLARLENHMAPKFVDIVDELPRTESGKIRHAALRGR
jgi:long-chain acyl-CoA synthetase